MPYRERERDDLGRFVAFNNAMDEATRNLRGFSTSTRDAAREQSGAGGGGGLLGAARGAAGMFGGMALQGAAAGVMAFNSTASVSAGVSSASMVLAQTLRSMPGGELVGAVTGANAKMDAAKETNGRVLGSLEDLVRYGVEVDNKFLRGEINEIFAQESRVQTFRTKVGGMIADKDGGNGMSLGMGLGFNMAVPSTMLSQAAAAKAAEAVSEIRDILRQRGWFGGGGGR